MSDEARDVQGEDVIVLNKWIVIAAGVAVLIFVAGGLGGFFLAKYAFDHGVQQAAALQVAQQPSAPQIQPTTPPSRIDGVKTDGDPQKGSDNAKVTIVEFSDFQCPYCKRFRDASLDALIEKYGDKVRFVFRDFPLTSIHPQAQIAAEAAECANEQGKFWEMHDLIYANQDALSNDSYKGFADQIGLDAQKFNDCLSTNKYADEIAADEKDGEAYGVTGTPTFFINGWRLVGAQPTSEFETLIDKELGG